MTPEEQLAAMTRDLALMAAERARRHACRFYHYFPTCQPTCRPNSPKREDHAGLCRALYVKHMQFVGAAIKHRERCFMAANRVGKTEMAAYEVTCHLTGLYPSWWHGKRFDRPTHWWASGDTTLTTRDILQVAMLGRVDGVDIQDWTGMLPAHLIENTTRKTGGIAKCIDQAWVKHQNAAGEIDGTSTLEFKSYDQGRRAFQGTAQDGVWLDEECPDDVYAECLLRTMTTEGLIIATLTPLQGLTPFIQQYIETSVMPDADGAEVASLQVWGDVAA